MSYPPTCVAASLRDRLLTDRKKIQAPLIKPAKLSCVARWMHTPHRASRQLHEPRCSSRSRRHASKIQVHSESILYPSHADSRASRLRDVGPPTRLLGPRPGGARADSDGRCRRLLRCAARPASAVERAGAGTSSTPKWDSQEREALRLIAVDGPRGIRIKPDRTTRVRHLIDTRMGLGSDTESRA